MTFRLLLLNVLTYFCERETLCDVYTIYEECHSLGASIAFKHLISSHSQTKGSLYIKPEQFKVCLTTIAIKLD